MAQIAFEQLVDLAEGRLEASEAAALRARIAADPSALAQMSALETLLDLMRDDTSVDAPEHVIRRAVRLMRQPGPLTVQGPLRRLVVALTQQAWQTPQRAAGLRSAQAWPRTMLLTAGDRELDLQVSPRGTGWQLVGQVLGSEEPGSVSLSNTTTKVSAVLSELGEFVMPPVVAGRYTLTLAQRDVEIVVPNIELGLPSNEI